MTKTPLTGQELSELAEGLNKLAHNLWWTWDQEAQDIFQELSPRGWHGDPRSTTPPRPQRCR